ncbi:MAG: hypothetical protein C0399_04245 [Syntrophus sp. (in: bacteria)]|nr:hypothetical protein [Syntrophus sp. (in: bacteria)]
MLDLGDLANGLPAISPAFGRYLAEAGAVCLESQGHVKGKEISVQGIHSIEYFLHWPDVTDQMERCLHDPEVATEHGAVGIAVLLMKRLIGFTVIQRSRKGTGFDYWLGDETDMPFQNKARLEVSGIRNGNQKVLKARVREKLTQTEVSDETRLPAYVVVVEFGQPLAEVRQR